jgi:DNA-binding response OmpR family regulator
MSEGGSLLVIDDEAEIVDALRDLFGEQGYTVQAALNGRDALALASRSRPDAVILDIRLPDREGPLVLRDLRALDPTIVVVMLSGTDDEDLARELLAEGAFDYVRKPLMFDNLEQIVSVAVLIGRRKPFRDVLTPLPCHALRPLEDAPREQAATSCPGCGSRVLPYDSSAVQERGLLHHAACWLGRMPAARMAARTLATGISLAG